MVGLTSRHLGANPKLKAPPSFIDALSWARTLRGKSSASVSPEEDLVVARFESLIEGLKIAPIQIEILHALSFYCTMCTYLMHNVGANSAEKALTLTQLSDALKIADRFFVERAMASPNIGASASKGSV